MKAKVIMPHVVDPYYGGETPAEHANRVREAYGIARKLASTPDIPDAEEVIEEVAVEEPTPVEEPDDFDEIRRAMQLGRDDVPAFWLALKQTRENLRVEKQRQMAKAAAKASKEAAPGAAAIVTEPATSSGNRNLDVITRELADLQSSPKGFTRSGRARRAQLREELRHAR